MWTTKGQAALFRPLLVFATDTRPKVRREAQTGVASLIRTAKASAPAHPIMEAAAKPVAPRLHEFRLPPFCYGAIAPFAKPCVTGADRC